MYQKMLFELSIATWQTLYMVIGAALIALMIGFPCGVILFNTSSKGLSPHSTIYRLLSIIVNILRSIPFIILLVALLPLTRFLVGTSIGTTAAMVPLSIGAFPFVARIVESSFHSVDSGLIDMGWSIGATKGQIVKNIMITEALPSIIHGITLMIITLVGFSAMAGAVGGGGLGDIAIRYGYQRFNTTMMLITIAILVIIVQMIQWAGDKLVKSFKH